MFVEKERFKFLKKRKEKSEEKKLTYLVIGKATKISEDSMKGYLSRKKSNAISEKHLKNLSRYFDCHPGYLNGTLNEKAIDQNPLLFKLSEEDFIKQFFRDLSHEEYLGLLAKYDGLIDDEGYFVPPFREYEYEEKRAMNVQDFTNWLRSINMFENPDFLEGFPSNPVLENVLSRMSYGEMQVFQGKVIEFISEYLTENEYIPDYGNYLIDDSKLTEEDIDRTVEESNRRFVKKSNEGLELYRKRKEEEDGKHSEN